MRAITVAPRLSRHGDLAEPADGAAALPAYSARQPTSSTCRLKYSGRMGSSWARAVER